jgi:hypothetical protein
VIDLDDVAGGLDAQVLDRDAVHLDAHARLVVGDDVDLPPTRPTLSFRMSSRSITRFSPGLISHFSSDMCSSVWMCATRDISR